MADKTPSKKSGSNTTPSERWYVTRRTKQMKDSVELYKTLKQRGKISQAERSCLAYFLTPLETDPITD